MSETGKRRLADKVIAAVNQACDQNEMEIAQQLVTALELILSRQGGKESEEKRKELSDIIDAFNRTIQLRRQTVG
jgi:hypothetical protein